MIYQNNINHKLRTKEFYDVLSNAAIEGYNSYVVKKTILSEVIDFPNMILIVYMHLIFEGECKYISSKWFDSKNFIGYLFI